MQRVELSQQEKNQIKRYYAKRWLDPINRIEDIFNVRKANGELIPLKVPEPQKKLIRDGILGAYKENIKKNLSYISVTDKGRQAGFSVIMAAEAILIAEDFPNSFIYYVATAGDQAEDWMRKVDQLIRDANHWPEELGGQPMLSVKNIEKVTTKNINGTLIVGLAANPASIRGKTGIAVYFDEAAWAVRVKNQAKETWKALKYIIRQGGSARIQSTPRVGDEEDFFWKLYKFGDDSETNSIHRYYCPIIENWEDLDLNEPLYICINNNIRRERGMKLLEEPRIKEIIDNYTKKKNFIVTQNYIMQNAKIPYSWISIEDLEQDRAEDLEQFKQENLGIPLDETYKILKSEWIYSNENEEPEWFDKGTSKNEFYMFCDFASIKDLTATTVVEKVKLDEENYIYVERFVSEMQGDYEKQADELMKVFKAFKPIYWSGDNTGPGIPIGDMIQKRLRNESFNPALYKRITFTNELKERMALGFRNLVMPNFETGKSKYRWLIREPTHQNAIRHCMRVERITKTGESTKYSGKQHGRDDHFWSKAQLALVEEPNKVPKAAFGKLTKDNPTLGADRRTYGEKFMASRTTVAPKINEYSERKTEQMMRLKSITKVLTLINDNMVICNHRKCITKQFECLNPKLCRNATCNNYNYCLDICNRYGVDVDEIWKHKKTIS